MNQLGAKPVIAGTVYDTSEEGRIATEPADPLKRTVKR